MIFLIEYDRPESRIVTFTTFKDSERFDAEKSRLDLELRLNRGGVDHEVVILEAESEEALRRTHRRYFEDARQIATSASASNG